MNRRTLTWFKIAVLLLGAGMTLMSGVACV